MAAVGAAPLRAGAAEPQQTAKTSAAGTSGEASSAEAASGGSSVTFPRVFQGSQLQTLAFPLGGIGTGSISLGGYGELRDWEIFNRSEKGRQPAYGFAAIWAQAGEEPAVARVVEARRPPPFVGERGFGWRSAPGLPRLERAVFTGEFPFATVDFTDERLPVEVTLEAWSPFVPLDVDATGFPVSVLRYRVRNPGPRPAQIALSFSLDNPVGAQGRVNQLWREGPVEGLFFSNPALDRADPFWGSFAVALAPSVGGELTYLTSWRDLQWNLPVRSFWEDFAADGRLDPSLHREAPQPGTFGPSSSVMSPVEVGSLSVSRSLDPGEEATTTFVLAWHFPNRTPSRCGWRPPPGAGDVVIGNRYCERFSDAWEAALAALADLPELERRSRAFTGVMRSSSLPEPVIEAAMSNLSTLRTNTCFQTADGGFHAFEGARDDGGCCSGSCTHVWNYEGALAALYPQLSRSVRESQFGYATAENGLQDFRYLLPYGQERYGQAAADGQMGNLVKLYLDWRLSGDLAWLRRLWPKAKLALEFAWIEGGWDADRDGVMEGCQHNTYDIEFLGPNPLCGVWYLAALRAGEEMATAVGDTAAAGEYRRLYERGSAWIDDHLWNGEYYIQLIQGQPLEGIAPGLYLAGRKTGDPTRPVNQVGEGCLVDQLLGQTVADAAGLGDLLDSEHLRGALTSILDNNFKRDLSEHAGVLRTYALGDEAGVVLCDFSRRPPPDTPFYFSSEVWTGCEYQLAASLYHRRRLSEADEIVEAVRLRHDGLRRNPWDEAECGHHYARALASWYCVLALCGFSYGAHDERLELDPKLPGPIRRGFWSVPSGWGSFTHSVEREVGEITIEALEGRLALRHLELGGVEGSTEVSVRLGSVGIGASATRADDRIQVELAQRIEVDAGHTLRLSIS